MEINSNNVSSLLSTSAMITEDLYCWLRRDSLHAAHEGFKTEWNDEPSRVHDKTTEGWAVGVMSSLRDTTRCRMRRKSQLFFSKE